MKRLIFGVILLGALLVAAPGWADTISDSFTVYDASGNVAYSVSVLEAIEDPNQIYYIPVIGLADPNQFNNATTLCEGNSICDANHGPYSDIFGVAVLADGNYYLAFNSDTELFEAAYGSQGAIFMPEGSGGYFDATVYLDPSFQARGYTAQFFSDSDVPEPATLALFGSGLGMLGSLRKRFMR